MPDTRPHRSFAFVCLLLALATHCGAAPGPQKSASRPNVLVILADDLGYADLNINNPQAGSPTPRLNELAQSGVRFTRFYTESSCSPSRAALLTGRYPARANFIPNGFGIPVELTTLPEAFKAAGYRTHHIGKWHVGHLVPEAWPAAQGFDTWLGFLTQWLLPDGDRTNGFIYGEGTHLDPYLQNEKNEIRRFPGHLTDIATDEAIRLIKNGEGDAPWFMYLAYLAPHEPIQPRADYEARFPDTAAGRYAALVAHLDDRIGDVLQALDATGQREKTIVVFASDNGGTNGHLDNNAPLRGKKVQYFEGGIRTPLLVSWPGHLRAGLVAGQVASIMDIYPTLAQLAGLRKPDALDGRTLFGSDRKLLDKPAPRTLFWEINNNVEDSYSVLSADGRWRFYQSWLGSRMLFDLRADPNSTNDVATQHPELVRQLQAEYANWKTAVAHIPLKMRQRDANGRGILEGDDLQRSARFSTFTIAIGITPARDAANGTQVILEQQSTLRVARDDAGLRVDLNGLNITLPALPPGRCSSLVLTGTINRRFELVLAKPSKLDIYIDGTRAGSATEDVTDIHSENMHAATFVGSAADGSQRFDGMLSEPIYLNSRADGPVPPALAVAALSRQVCSADR